MSENSLIPDEIEQEELCKLKQLIVRKWPHLILGIASLFSFSLCVYAGVSYYKEQKTQKLSAVFEQDLKSIESSTSAFARLKENPEEQVVKNTHDRGKNSPQSNTQAPINYPEIAIPRPFSVLLLGYDRRSKTESPYRTDVMMLISLSQDKTKLLMTSIPRDLWIDGARINAFYAQGPSVMKLKVQKVTSFPVDRYVGIDFEDFKWLIDFLGGVEVNVDRAFTDSQYPNNWDTGVQSVHFESGYQKLNGERALQYSRSRKGDNGEGSDFARSARQQKVLLALANSIPAKCSGDEATCFSAISNHVDTDLTLTDASAFIEAVSRVSSMTTSRVVLDLTYLYNPPMEQYGGAWVLVPKDNSYKSIQNMLASYLK